MNKKFVQAIACICFFAISFQSASAVYTSSGSGYNDLVIKTEMNFSAVLNGDKVDTSWVPYAPSGFKYYKVVRSTTNPNPVYPEDGYIKVDSDSNASGYTDKSAPSGTIYYRVCSIVKPERYCSNVVAINKGSDTSVTLDSDDFTATATAKDVTTKTTTTDKSTKVTEFSDVYGHDYKTAIDYLKDINIVNGYADGSYKPDYPINRAEFMKIIMEAKFSSEIGNAGNCFRDVASAWYAPYVCAAKNKGIVSGYSDGMFKPANNINFVEAAKILAEAYGLDITSGGIWYEGYVKALQGDNYIPPTINRLDKPVSRAEMAELIWRIKGQKKDKSSIKLIHEPISVNSGDYASWATYNGDGFSFNHPNWYRGFKWGWDLLTDEKDFIDNINVPNYMDVDSYLSVYTVSGSNLHTSVWFGHPLVSSTELTINGVTALKRHYRAPRGTVVNGRTTGENENITIYTYRLSNGKVAVLQYFNAYGKENYNVGTFYKIAESFVSK